MDGKSWRIEQSVATLVDPAWGGGAATIDLANPSRGLVGVPGVSGAVLGIQAASASATELRLADAYVRGADLVARFTPSTNFPFGTEVYWRVGRRPEPPTIELIASVQTDLLDTHPKLMTRSVVGSSSVSPIVEQDGVIDAASELDQDMPKAVGCLAGAGPVWVEFAHPSDRREALLEAARHPGDTVSIGWRLFSAFLEKGVIRRARITAALLSSADPTTVGALYRRFATQAPPLTA
ncbi:MAG: hypothetical protein AAGB00_12235 [Planctomycetota bacterium]